MHPTEQQLHQEAVHKIFALTERDAPQPQDEADQNGSFVNGLNNFLLACISKCDWSKGSLLGTA